MSGAYAVAVRREIDYELRETPEQRARRALVLRRVYALADPDGWDGRRLSELDLRAIARITDG